MQISIPSVPDNLTYCVVAALGIDIVGTILLAGGGAVLPGLAALALAAAVYWFVYRNLEDDAATASRAAAIIAVIHLAFAVAALVLHNPFGFVLDGIAAACLGYVFTQFRQPVRL
jgi:hypothetical protein